jgi:hypothetical protein
MVYSMQQADNMALNAIRSSQKPVTGIYHQPEFYSPVCKATIPEVYQVFINGELIDEVYSLDQAKTSLAKAR